MKSSVDKFAALLGRVARPSTATDLLTLSLGMILGFLIGAISFPIAGSKVGLGNAGGLLVSGVIVSSVVSRLRFFGNTPNAARNILEDLGLVVFIAIVGINAGAGLITQLTGAVALKIFIAGFIVCTTIPPILVWAIGYHVMKINPAVLMGGVAGARSHSGPAREAAKEIGSSVPWIGFPVGYAVSGVLLTVFGYFAMTLVAVVGRRQHSTGAKRGLSVRAQRHDRASRLGKADERLTKPSSVWCTCGRPSWSPWRLPRPPAGRRRSRRSPWRPSGEWREFEGSWNAAGTRRTIPLGADRQGSIVDLRGTMLLAGHGAPRRRIPLGSDRARRQRNGPGGPKRLDGRARRPGVQRVEGRRHRGAKPHRGDDPGRHRPVCRRDRLL